MGRTHFTGTKKGETLHFTRKGPGQNPTLTYKGQNLEIHNKNGKFSLTIDGTPFSETTSNRGHLIELFTRSLKTKTTIPTTTTT